MKETKSFEIRQHRRSIFFKMDSWLQTLNCNAIFIYTKWFNCINDFWARTCKFHYFAFWVPLEYFKCFLFVIISNVNEKALEGLKRLSLVTLLLFQITWLTILELHQQLHKYKHIKLINPIYCLSWNIWLFERSFQINMGMSCSTMWMSTPREPARC